MRALLFASILLVSTGASAQDPTNVYDWMRWPAATDEQRGFYIAGLYDQWLWIHTSLLAEELGVGDDPDRVDGIHNRFVKCVVGWGPVQLQRAMMDEGFLTVTKSVAEVVDTLLASACLQAHTEGGTP